MPDNFLFSYASFDDVSRPFLEWQRSGEAGRVPAFGQDLALEFDFSKRFCTGWVDFTNRRSCACPDEAVVDDKYENCLKCRNLTGFNPAFYHAAAVSEQQQQINQTPHYLYLAYFAPGVVKVGISQQARGNKRLLEQGARAAVKLETFDSALVARQYEAKIARLDGVLETVPSAKKFGLLRAAFDQAAAEAELAGMLARIEQTLNVRFEKREPVDTEKYFYNDNPVDITTAVDMTGSPIAGSVVACIGTILITKYGDRLLAYNLKKYFGYRAQQAEHIELELPSEQLALF